MKIPLCFLSLKGSSGNLAGGLGETENFKITGCWQWSSSSSQILQEKTSWLYLVQDSWWPVCFLDVAPQHLPSLSSCSAAAAFQSAGHRKREPPQVLGNLHPQQFNSGSPLCWGVFFLPLAIAPSHSGSHSIRTHLRSQGPCRVHAAH